MNVVEGLQAIADERREFIQQLDETERALGSEGGESQAIAGLAISRAVANVEVNAAEKAIASGDVLQMLAVYGQLGGDVEEVAAE